MTVRHSLDILQLEGLIERRRGRSGVAFVLAESLLLESVRIEGLTRWVVSGESGVSTKVLSLTQIPAPVPIVGPLKIAEDAAVWELRRLKLQETTPVMLSTHSLPVEIYPTLDDRLSSIISCEMMATLRRYSGVLSRKGGTAFSNSGRIRAVGCGRRFCAVENRTQVEE